jgi:DNA-binding transcriptional LysR family regulator
MGAFAAHGRFRDIELANVPFVVPVRPLEGAPSGVKGHDAWPDAKIERLVRYRVDLLATGLEIARQGLAAIFIPRFVARLHNESVTLANRLEPLRLTRGLASVKRDVFIVKRESSAENAITRKIAQALRDICVD